MRMINYYKIFYIICITKKIFQLQSGTARDVPYHPEVRRQLVTYAASQRNLAV